MKFEFARSLRQRFLSNTSGNVAIIAGLAIIPIMSVAGLAVDFQLVVTKKNVAQQTLDVTVIAAARERQEGASDSEVRTFTQDYFETLLNANDPALQCDSVSVQFMENSEQIDAEVECTQPTTLSAIFGRDKFEFVVGSGSTFGVGEVDVAFVFDLSGSMNRNNRLTSLKLAAKDAIGILLPEDAPSSDSVRIAISTYNHSVNAGAFFENVVEFNDGRPNRMEVSEAVGDVYDNQYKGVVQVDRSGNRENNFWDFEALSCNNNNCSRASDFAGRFFYDTTCVYNRIGDEAFSDAAPEEDQYLYAGHPIWDFGNNRTENNRNLNLSKQRGFEEVLDIRGTLRHGMRNGGRNSASFFNNVNANRDITSNGSFIYGVRQNGNINDGQPITGCRDNSPVTLTDDTDALNTFIDDMTAGGGTAGHLGIAWGWYLISPEWRDIWPDDSRPLDYFEPETAKAMIIMTDGAFNAEHPDAESNMPNGSRTSTEMSAAYCDNIKATSNITIFTVRFDISRDRLPQFGGTDILTYCASGASRALGANNGEELREQFRSIAAEISDLRLAQ